MKSFSYQKNKKKKCVVPLNLTGCDAPSRSIRQGCCARVWRIHLRTGVLLHRLPFSFNSQRVPRGHRYTPTTFHHAGLVLPSETTVKMYVFRRYLTHIWRRESSRVLLAALSSEHSPLRLVPKSPFCASEPE